MAWYDFILDPFIEMVEGWINDAFAFLKRIVRSALSAITNVFKKIFGYITDWIKKPLDGISIMIENFRRIVCLLGSFPKRARNVTSGLKDIFEGVGMKWMDLGTAFYLGFASIGDLLKYSAEYLNSRLQCGLKFIKNFYRCFLFYILDIIGKILYLVPTVIIFLLRNIFNVDLRPTEESFWEGMEILNEYFFKLTGGHHLIHFSSSVRNDCYVCKRLTDEAVGKQAQKVKTTFTETIPNVMSSGPGQKRIIRGGDKFKEAGKTWVREPSEVK